MYLVLQVADATEQIPFETLFFNSMKVTKTESSVPPKEHTIRGSDTIGFVCVGQWKALLF